MNITETSLHPSLPQLQVLITNSICLCNWSVDVSGHKQGLRMVKGGRLGNDANKNDFFSS